MNTVKLWVGTVVAMTDGRTQDETRAVEFQGEKLGELRTFGTHNGRLSDTRGTTEMLYRTEDGRLVVHVNDWSRWVGEPDVYSLHEVSEDGLQPGGAYEELGAACGYGRALTLDEALDQA